MHVLKSAVHLKFVQIRSSGDGLSTMAAWRVGMRIDGEIRRAGANLRGIAHLYGYCLMADSGGTLAGTERARARCGGVKIRCGDRFCCKQLV